MRIDTCGDDFLPHTFIVIKHDNGTYDEYGLIPKKNGSMYGPGKIDVKIGVKSEVDLHESQRTYTIL